MLTNTFITDVNTKVTTLEQFLICVTNDFDTQNCKLSRLIKITLFETLIKQLNRSIIIDEGFKQKLNACTNLYDFIIEINKYYKGETYILTPQVKTQLLINLPMLIKLTNCKTFKTK